MRERDPIPAALRRPEQTPIVRIGLRPAEAAEALGVCLKHLRNLADGPPVARLGGALVYPVDLLAEWLRVRAEASVEVAVPDAD